MSQWDNGRLGPHPARDSDPTLAPLGYNFSIKHTDRRSLIGVVKESCARFSNCPRNEDVLLVFMVETTQHSSWYTRASWMKRNLWLAPTVIRPMGIARRLLSNRLNPEPTQLGRFVAVIYKDFSKFYDRITYGSTVKSDTSVANGLTMPDLPLSI